MAKSKGAADAVGRPALFKTEKEIRLKGEIYFEFIKGERKKTKTGKESRLWLRKPENPSITALAYYLGFESRQSFYDYEKNGEFSYTIKNFRLRIEMFYEQNLLSFNTAGAIFALKNFGWKDKIDVTTDEKPLTEGIDYTKLPTEVLQALINATAKN